jgi:hypothetical protein
MLGRDLLRPRQDPVAESHILQSRLNLGLR